MSLLSQGTWGIESVIVNSETVMNFEGFEQLRVNNNQISILPIGLSFEVVEATKQRLVLMSREQVFFADLEDNESSINLKLTRPDFAETIEINAHAVEDARATVEREVVRV